LFLSKNHTHIPIAQPSYDALSKSILQLIVDAEEICFTTGCSGLRAATLLPLLNSCAAATRYENADGEKK